MSEELKKKWKDKGFLKGDYPEENLDMLLERYEDIEKWGEKEQEKGREFNWQFYADLYALASMMSRDNSFKGKFKLGELYEEMCQTMNTMKKGKKEYSMNDESKMFQKVMDNHSKAIKKK